MIAQEGNHVGNADAGSIAAEDLAGAIQAADPGAEIGFGILISGGETTFGSPPPLCFGVLADAG